MAVATAIASAPVCAQNSASDVDSALLEQREVSVRPNADRMVDRSIVSGPEVSLEEAVMLQMPRETGSIGREKACLTEAIYFESRGEPLKGQMAVAQVIINRTKSNLYPNSICGVVNQRGQFSYSREGNLRPTGDLAWRRSREIAELAQQWFWANIAEAALSFHSVRVSPSWRKRMRQVGRIGAHIFYAARR